MEDSLKNLKLCKVMIAETMGETKTFRVQTVEYCIDREDKSVEMLTGENAGEYLLRYDHANVEDGTVCVDVHDIKTLKTLFPSNNLDQIRGNLEEMVMEEEFVLNTETGELEPLNFCEAYTDNKTQDKDIPKKDKKVKKKTTTKKKTNDVLKIDHEIRKVIVGQDQAIRVIAAVANGNQKIIDSNISFEEKNHLKKNILIAGKSGTGKTEIIIQLAKHLNVPYVIEDATRYTKAGYVGESVEDMLKNLIRKANYNIDLAQRGILVIDEIDKLRKLESRSDDVGAYDVQVALLKIIEGGTFNIKMSQHDNDIMTFDTSLLTVIVSGAFMDMFEGRETVTKPLGFNTEEPKKETKAFEPEDFIKYGMAPELMGRIPTIVMMNDLTKDDYKQIIRKSKLSPLLLERMNLRINNVSLKVHESFIDYVADEAMKLGIGARGIRTVFYKLLGDLDFDVLKGDLKQVNLTKDKVVRIRKKDDKSEVKQLKKV